jgi:arabinofuranosyltransferase
LLVLAPVVVLLVLGWQMRWVSDDGFIHLRVVQQIVGGNGPVFNAGERIEASTSPLWVLLLTLVEPLPGLPLQWKAVLLGLGLSATGLLLAQRAAVRLARPRSDELVLPLGAIVVAALPPFWEFATSGLETGMVFAWIGASTWWCVRRVTAETPVSRRSELAGAMVVGLGYPIRPDLGLFVVAFGAVLLAEGWPDGRGERLRIAAALMVAPLVVQLFRMGYYALLVPHTALAKEAGGSQWGQGWTYLGDLVTPYLLWWPLLLLGAVVVVQVRHDLRDDARLRAGARAAPAVAAVLYAFYVVKVGGDFMHARLLLPALFGLLAPVGIRMPADAVRRPFELVRMNGRLRERLPVYGAAAVIGWALVCGAWLRPSYHGSSVFGVDTLPVRADGTIEDERELFQALWSAEHPIGLDRPLPEDAHGAVPVPVPGKAVLLPDGTLEPVQVELTDGRVGAEAAIGQFAIGSPSYAWGPGVEVVDLQSLAHPVGGHLDLRANDRPGHQKPVPFAWQVTALSPVREIKAADGQVLLSADDADAARQALGCGQLGRYLQDIRAPMTPKRFLGNIVDSFGNTTFRVPPDPQDALHQFCGD